MNEQPKAFNNTEIMKSHKRIVDAINEELKNGMPVSVVSIILHTCVADVDAMLNAAMASENEKASKQ